MSKTINAAVYARHGNPADVLRVESRPWPRPAPDEALVQMRAAPINPADLNQIEGKYPVRAGLPATPGFEGAGIVVDAGGKAPQKTTRALVFFARNLLHPRAAAVVRERGI